MLTGADWCSLVLSGAADWCVVLYHLSHFFNKLEEKDTEQL